ncbi:unnamed protein product [Oppiella nova]|uniref:Uncharacterized protein n=1 Tax=Oppiella nova TaxID=334625 RepID=A0A7R9QU44_9ACAR|nr:unnamed protein product [Oppiella nova]CAG2174987.1 unnamed protein product [Oppiella nova]
MKSEIRSRYPRFAEKTTNSMSESLNTKTSFSAITPPLREPREDINCPQLSSYKCPV